MVDGRLFDTLHDLAARLRKPTDKPFGGIQVRVHVNDLSVRNLTNSSQLVVTGDFFQLPPVAKGDPVFAFESDAWKSSIEETVNLKQVYRQKDTSTSSSPVPRD